jgi:hypothetical protein
MVERPRVAIDTRRDAKRRLVHEDSSGDLVFEDILMKDEMS